MHYISSMEYNKGQYNFKKDILTGEQGQEFIIKFMEGKGFKYLGSNDTISHDLEMSYKGRRVTYEVKTDVYPRDTGNMVIEFECRGKSSGINATSADYFTYFFPALGEIWNIECGRLRKLIGELKPHVFLNAGDSGSGTKLYRLKKEEVKDYFKVHKL